MSYFNRLQSEYESSPAWHMSYLGLLVFGLVFFASCSFHKSMWFDEAYTLAMIRHDFLKIIEITARDVHPPLYYAIIKTASLIWGQNIVVYRLVAVAGMILLSLLGYTHIRKILGNRAGIYYIFLTIFLPVMLDYSGEARMYTWAVFFTTAAGIYAYLSYCQSQAKSWILFAIFSLCGAYTHYYALLGVGFINLILLAAVLTQKPRLLKACFAAMAAEVICYLPWIVILINQIISVTQEYWIVINYQYLLRDFSVFYFAENLPEAVSMALSFLLVIICGIGILQAVRTQKRHLEICVFCLLIYLAVIVLALILSLVQPIFITRYLMPNSGLLFIALAFGLSSYRKKLMPLLLCLVILAASLVNFYLHFEKIYDPANGSLQNNIADSLKPGDIFLYSDIHPAGIYSVSFPNNKHYVYFPSDNPPAETKPNPFQPELEIIYDLNALKDYQGRIWLLENMYSQTLYGHLGKEESIFTVIDYARVFEMPYLAHKGFAFTAALFEKKSGSIPEFSPKSE